MRYQWKDLKQGMMLFRDRIDDLYGDDHVAYFELLNVTGDVDDNEKEITRQSVYVYGDLKPYNDSEVDPISKEYNAGVSSPDSMWMTDEGWTTAGWHAVQFLTEEEMKQRIVKYIFNDFY